MQRAIVILICLFTLAGNGLAADNNAALNYPALTQRLLEQRPEFGAAGTYDARTLRLQIMALIDSARYLGLDNSRFHRHAISEDAQGPSAYYADALISYCHDLIRSPKLSGSLGFDEIYGNYRKQVEDLLVSRLAAVHNGEELRALIAALQPPHPDYKALLAELQTQLQQNNTVKIGKITTSLAWYRWAHFFNFDKLIVVNIAAAGLRYYEAGKEILQMKVVVGKPSTKTPRFAAYCNQVILYPYWHVPRSIAVNEILPKCKRDPGTVNAMNLQVLNSRGNVVSPGSINWSAYNRSNFPYTFRQSTGCDNALGVIKFNLTSPFSVYLHDTNFKKAFSSGNRYLSHGCIRIEMPVELANHILPDSLDTEFLKACVRRQKPVPMNITPVPVFVTYMPAEVDSVGTVVYHEDVYRLLGR